MAAMLPADATVGSSASELQSMGTASPLLQVPAEMLIASLSYSHFELLLALNDPLQRAFYEVECLRGGWSVRELKRQIGSVSYERTALSRDKEALIQHVNSLAETEKPELILRDPVVFEFLGIRAQDTMLESDLEHVLLDKLEPFLLELGRGFCFEARQKRILIGGEYFFVDLVFYHRILKCHILVDLRLFPSIMKTLGSSIPISPGLPRMSAVKATIYPLAYYCAPARTTRLSERYQVALPDKEQIASFIATQLRNVTQ